MAYITQAHSNIFPAIWEKISGFFVTVGRSLVLSAAMDSRLKRVEALNLKTDEELAKMPIAKKNKSNLIVVLNIDSEAKMGLISDVKQQLREVDTRRISYIAKGLAKRK